MSQCSWSPWDGTHNGAGRPSTSAFPPQTKTTTYGQQCADRVEYTPTASGKHFLTRTSMNTGGIPLAGGSRPVQQGSTVRRVFGMNTIPYQTHQPYQSHQLLPTNFSYTQLEPPGSKRIKVDLSIFDRIGKVGAGTPAGNQTPTHMVVEQPQSLVPPGSYGSGNNRYTVIVNSAPTNGSVKNNVQHYYIATPVAAPLELAIRGSTHFNNQAHIASADQDSYFGSNTMRIVNFKSMQQFSAVKRNYQQVIRIDDEDLGKTVKEVLKKKMAPNSIFPAKAKRRAEKSSGCSRPSSCARTIPYAEWRLKKDRGELFGNELSVWSKRKRREHQQKLARKAETIILPIDDNWAPALGGEATTPAFSPTPTSPKPQAEHKSKKLRSPRRRIQKTFGKLVQEDEGDSPKEKVPKGKKRLEFSVRSEEQEELVRLEYLKRGLSAEEVLYLHAAYDTLTGTGEASAAGAPTQPSSTVVGDECGQPDAGSCPTNDVPIEEPNTEVVKLDLTGSNWDHRSLERLFSAPKLKLEPTSRFYRRACGPDNFHHFRYSRAAYNGELADVVPLPAGCARVQPLFRPNKPRTRKTVTAGPAKQEFIRRRLNGHHSTLVAGGGEVLDGRFVHHEIHPSAGLQSCQPMRSVVMERVRKRRVKFARSSIHGWGLFLMEPVAADEEIIEYVGVVVRHSVADVRENRYRGRGMGSDYMFRVDGEWVVDATYRGNYARFINHCCRPNCYGKVVVTAIGEKRILICSKVDIQAGEELTYDYKFEAEDDTEDHIECLCGVKGCRKRLN